MLIIKLQEDSMSGNYIICKEGRIIKKIFLNVIFSFLKSNKEIQSKNISGDLIESEYPEITQ